MDEITPWSYSAGGTTEFCDSCGSLEIHDDYEHGRRICTDCESDYGPLIDMSDDIQWHSKTISRCGAPVNPLYPSASNSLIIKHGRYDRWGSASYNDRKIYDIQKLLTSFVGDKLPQAIVTDILSLTKIAREKLKNKKRMSEAFLAAAYYQCCIGRGMAMSEKEIKELFKIKDSEDERRFAFAKKTMETIVAEKEYTIKISSEDGTNDNSGIYLGMKICEEHNMPTWFIESIVTILHKLNQKNIMQNVVVKNRVAATLHFVSVNNVLIKLPIDEIVRSIGAKSNATILKQYSILKDYHYDGLMKYINAKINKFKATKKTITIDTDQNEFY